MKDLKIKVETTYGACGEFKPSPEPVEMTIHFRVPCPHCHRVIVGEIRKEPEIQYQYYRNVRGCKASSRDDPSCICWHDAINPPSVKVDGFNWRIKPHGEEKS